MPDEVDAVVEEVFEAAVDAAAAAAEGHEDEEELEDGEAVAVVAADLGQAGDGDVEDVGSPGKLLEARKDPWQQLQVANRCHYIIFFVQILCFYCFHFQLNALTSYK